MSDLDPITRLVGLPADVSPARAAALPAVFVTVAATESPPARLARLEAQPLGLLDTLLAAEQTPSAPAVPVAEAPRPAATATPPAAIEAADAPQFSLRQTQIGKALNPLSSGVPLADFARTRPTFFPPIAIARSRPPVNPITTASPTAPETRAPRLRPIAGTHEASSGEFVRTLVPFLEFADTRKIGQVVNELVN